MDYLAALDALGKWAERTDSVRGVLVTGSAAAGDVHPLSDRDIEIYTYDIESLLEDESWWNGLGEVLVVERLEHDLHPTRLIYYAGGKLDFTLIPAGDLATAIHTRPFLVLVDKDARAPQLPSTAEPPSPPGPDEVDEAIHWGYAAALMCAKAVVRDELWSAQLRDNDLKVELLRMIEWDHRLRYGASIDTRYLGNPDEHVDGCRHPQRTQTLLEPLRCGRHCRSVASHNGTVLPIGRTSSDGPRPDTFWSRVPCL